MNFPRFAQHLLATAISAIISTPLMATNQEASRQNDAENIQASGVEELIVTGRRDAQSVDTLIGQVGRLSAEDLQRIAHAHIQEAAVRVPGVWLSRGDGQELLAAVRSPVYTGPGSCGETLIAENGLPIRPSGLCNVNQLFETNSEQAGGLEIWRGAGTVFYGSNAMHGVVNVLSPQLDSNYLALEGGYHDYYRAKLGYRYDQGEHQWQVVANANNNGSFKDDAGFDQQKLSLQHRYRGGQFNAQTHLSLTNLNQETAGYVRGFEAYDNGSWNDNANPEAYRDAYSVRLSSRVEFNFDDGAQLLVTPYLRASDMEFIQHYLPGQAIEENGQHSLGVSSSYRLAMNDQVNLWVGMDLEAADMWVKETQEQSDVAFGSSPVRYQGVHYDFEVSSQMAAVFSNVEWDLTEATMIEAGVRLEHLRYDYDNRMLDGATRDDGSACGSSCRYFRPEDRRDQFTNVSSHVGFNHQLDDYWTLYGRVANAYRAPQINERYRLLNGQDVDQFEEKELQSAELGARYRGDRLSADISVYRMDKDDVILKASNNQTVGDGETKHTGVDLELAYEINEQWLMTLAAAWAKHEVVKSSALNGNFIDGNLMDTAPKWQGSAQLAYQYSERSRAELEWVFLDDYYLDAENSAEYDGHNLFNLRVQTRWNNQWSSSLRLKNLLDERYAERADFAFGSYRYFVGEGRAAYLEVRRKF